jgi:tetratricopeptide (TPR) repeat protein
MQSPGVVHPLIADGLAALKVRDHARAAHLLRQASAVVSEAEMPWPALGNAELALGKLDSAEQAIDRQLILAKRDVGALLLKGYLREQGGDARAASSFYQAGLNQAAISGSPAGLTGLIDRARHFLSQSQIDYAAHLIEAVGKDISPVMQEAMDLLLGKSQIYLQQPSMFYYPHLPQKWFYDPDDFPWMEAVTDLLPAMCDELELPASEHLFAPYVTTGTDRPAPNNPLLNDPAWGALYFWKNGAQVAENSSRCPATMKALEQAPMLMIPGRAPNALWSRLLPGTHIAPHHGLLNTRLICHVPIRTAPSCTLRVGSETRSWETGRALIFDDTIEHEARNAGQGERVVLLFEIWRPEIPEEDRDALSRIFAAIDGYGLN